MKNLKLFSFVFCGIALAIVGCSKGSAGPAGPAGPPGPDSVVHSKWITLSMALNVGTANDTFYTQTIVAPAITQKILDSGIVLTYLGFVDNNSITNVAIASPYFFNEIFTPGSISLLSFSNYTGTDYRYVVVPGTVVAGNITSGPAKGLTKQQLKDMSYQAVIKLAGQSADPVNNQ
jgi:hypothetical protein